MPLFYSLIISGHFINCAVKPFIPTLWAVLEHKKTGSSKWSPKIVLFASDKQAQSFHVGRSLRSAMANLPALNANVLDYLLDHPELIPSEWKGKKIIFWGTIYSSAGKDPSVRYLYWDGIKWNWAYYWLNSHSFDINDLAALAG